MHMSEEPCYCCHVCGAFAARDGDWIDEGGEGELRDHFVYLYRERGKPLGLCNVCFDARRFEEFAAHEIAYFYEEFTKPD